MSRSTSWSKSRKIRLEGWWMLATCARVHSTRWDHTASKPSLESVVKARPQRSPWSKIRTIERLLSLSLKSQRDLYECVETSSWDLSKDTLFNRKNSSGILNGPASSPRVPRSRLSWREWIFGGCVLRSRGPALDAKGPKGWASTSVSPRTRNSTELSTVAKGPRRSGRRS